MIKRILIVDDEEMIRETFQEFLTEFGYLVFTAENGNQALQMLDELAAQNTPIEFIFSDFYMPKMSGLQLFKEIRELPYDGKFVMITGYQGELDEHRLKADGITDILYKPIELRKLIELIEKAEIA